MFVGCSLCLLDITERSYKLLSPRMVVATISIVITSSLCRDIVWLL